MVPISQCSCRDREVQEATRGRLKRCEVTDDPVVVMKFRPVKAGNSGRRKPERLDFLLSGAGMSQKPYQLRRGEVYLKRP